MCKYTCDSYTYTHFFTYVTPACWAQKALFRYEPQFLSQYIYSSTDYLVKSQHSHLKDLIVYTRLQFAHVSVLLVPFIRSLMLLSSSSRSRLDFTHLLSVNILLVNNICPFKLIVLISRSTLHAHVHSLSMLVREIFLFLFLLKPNVDRSFQAAAAAASFAFFIHLASMAAAVKMLTDKAIQATLQIYCQDDHVVTIIVRDHQCSSFLTGLLTTLCAYRSGISIIEISVNTSQR